MAEELFSIDNTILKTLLDNIHDGVYLTDLQCRIRYWNKCAERMTGFKAEEAIGHCCSDDFLQPIDMDGALLCKECCPLAATMKDGETRKAKVYFHHKEGRRVLVSITVAPIYDEKSLSNAVTFSPWVIWPVLSTRTTASISRLPILGLAIGIMAILRLNNGKHIKMHSPNFHPF